jgi:hypothetical protein
MQRDYLTFITSEYQNSTKFLEWMDSLISRMVEAHNLVDSMEAAFDLDQASGAQLDTLGVIIGVSRYLRVPIPGLFFSWYDGSSPTELLGWELGSWRDNREGFSTEMSILPDDAYRQILKLKVIQNSWKGTLNELYTAWGIIFADEELTFSVVDNQDMTVDITILGSLIPATIQYILLGNEIPMKPAGVEVNYHFTEVAPHYHLVDEDGNRITDEDGAKIILDL